MNTPANETRDRICIKDVCLQVGVWGMLVVGFLTVCIAVPLLALNI
ncbi:hypothetical protein KDM41_00580 [bacterium]|nr:hypothetical protein [bacterium]